MTTDRTLHWDGCRNVRDLGRLSGTDGHTTRWGALVRGDDPTRLTPKGWQALLNHGVRTIISLRTRGKTEYNFDPALVPPDVTLLSESIEDLADLNFKAQWVDTGLWCTPLYYRDALQRWPKAHANVVRHFATAPKGGVLIHCGRGYDRTGIISLLFLSLAGVAPEDIVRDYALSVDPKREQILTERQTSTHALLMDVLQSFDAADYLTQAGLTPETLNKARQRLFGPQ